MTREDTKRILNFIFTYRPLFKNNVICGNEEQQEKELQRLINEWYFVFLDYDYDDVNDSVKSFLTEDNSGLKIPTPYQLTKYLVKTSNKFQEGVMYSKCMFCQKIFEYGPKLTLHENRCRSVNYLKLLYKNYIGREIDDETTKDLMNMNQYKFDETYYLILQKAYDKMPDGPKKENLKMVLETR